MLILPLSLLLFKLFALSPTRNYVSRIVMTLTPAYLLYAEQLLPLLEGYPLLNADPGMLYDQARPGDVGYIDPAYGKFIRTFNIFFPGDHEINRNGVPEGFERLPIDWNREVDKGLQSPPNVFKSQDVNVIGVKLNADATAIQNNIDLDVTCTNTRGAALLIKYQAYFTNALPQGKMKEYFVEHCDSWINFIKNTLGRSVELSDIILVSGCTQTADWAATLFRHKSSDARVSFQVGHIPIGSAGFSFQLKNESRHSAILRQGPMIADGLSDLHQVDDIRIKDGHVFNQTIFLRGYRMKKRIFKNELANIEMKAAAGYDKLPDSEDDDHQAYSATTSAEWELSTDLMDIVDAEDVDDDNVENVYDVVLDYILENSNAEIAVVQDEDLFPLLCTMQDLSGFESKLQGTPIVEEFGHGVIYGSISLKPGPIKKDSQKAKEKRSITLDENSGQNAIGAGTSTETVRKNELAATFSPLPCVFCWSRKKRCDRKSPCTYCLERGIKCTYRRSCVFCSNRLIRCDGRNPCGLCLRRSIECTYVPPYSSDIGDDPSVSSTKSNNTSLNLSSFTSTLEAYTNSSEWYESEQRQKSIPFPQLDLVDDSSTERTTSYQAKQSEYLTRTDSDRKINAGLSHMSNAMPATRTQNAYSASSPTEHDTLSRFFNTLLDGGLDKKS